LEEKRRREVGGETNVRASAVGDWEREGGVAGPAGQVGPNRAVVVSWAAEREKEKRKGRAGLKKYNKRRERLRGGFGTLNL
jgi:hypothetical protein